MKESTKKTDLEEAARTLGVAANAPLSAVEEAYRDLKTVWDPGHFVNDERLRKRAEAERQRIDEAYQLMTASLAPHDPVADLWSVKGKASRADIEKAKPAHEAGPSLIDEVLESHPTQRARRFPMWLIVAILLAVAVAVFALLPANGKKPLESVLESEGKVEPPALATPPPTPASEAGAGKSEPPAAQPQVTKPADAKPKPDLQRAAPGAQPRTATAQPAPARTEPQPADKPQLVRDEGNQIAQKEVKAYQILHQKSDAARRLIEGQVAGFRVIDWQTTPRQGDEFLVVLAAESAGNAQPVYLAWAVDTAKQTVRPMSQAARDLEGKR